MTEVLKNISLKPYNTFGIDVLADFFVEVNSVESLIAILKLEEFKKVKKLFLGGGSNILLLKDFDGLVIKINIKGITIQSENNDELVLKVGSGVVWHGFVMHCVTNDWAGVENLSLIPGTVGAAPMQNIGAYGVEIKDVFEKLEALNLDTLQLETFNLEQCHFGYRESFFKHEGKNKYVILNVSFRLSKNPVFKTSYGAIKETLEAENCTKITIKAISDAVIKIRQSKLPDPKQIGNSGSFFKNPEISKELFDQVKAKFNQIPSYPINENTVKVPAGWLIEQAGWKGKRFGQVGVHDKQALVLVNFGGGTGAEIRSLALEIQKSIKDKFNIEISPEVNFIE